MSSSPRGANHHTQQQAQHDFNNQQLYHMQQQQKTHQQHHLQDQDAYHNMRQQPNQFGQQQQQQYKAAYEASPAGASSGYGAYQQQHQNAAGGAPNYQQQHGDDAAFGASNNGHGRYAPQYMLGAAQGLVKGQQAYSTSSLSAAAQPSSRMPSQLSSVAHQMRPPTGAGRYSESSAAANQKNSHYNVPANYGSMKDQGAYQQRTSQQNSNYGMPPPPEQLDQRHMRVQARPPAMMNEVVSASPAGANQQHAQHMVETTSGKKRGYNQMIANVMMHEPPKVSAGAPAARQPDQDSSHTVSDCDDLPDQVRGGPPAQNMQGEFETPVKPMIADDKSVKSDGSKDSNSIKKAGPGGVKRLKVAPTLAKNDAEAGEKVAMLSQASSQRRGAARSSPKNLRKQSPPQKMAVSRQQRSQRGRQALDQREDAKQTQKQSSQSSSASQEAAPQRGLRANVRQKQQPEQIDERAEQLQAQYGKRTQKSPPNSRGAKAGRTKRSAAIEARATSTAAQQRAPSERVRSGKQPQPAPDASVNADNIYSKSYQYSGTRGARTRGCGAARGVGRPSSSATKQKMEAAQRSCTRSRRQSGPASSKGRRPVKASSPTSRSKRSVSPSPTPVSSQSKVSRANARDSRSKSKAATGSGTKASRKVNKSSVSSVLQKSEDEIQEILQLYFDFICTEFAPCKKIQDITVGQFLKKVVVEHDRTITLSVSNIFFHQYNPKGGIDRSRERNASDEGQQRQRRGARDKSVSPNTASGNKTSARQRSNTKQEKAYGKDFRIGDIIDFTQQKVKDQANLYLIRDIQIVLDFSGKQNKVEKQDKKLPDIEIKFKVHPIIQSYSSKAFPEAEQALKYINENIEADYALDKNSTVCLFEIGQREIKDDRLDFGHLVQTFQQVQKSFQMKYAKQELHFKSKLRQCRDQNKLCNSNNYEKDYIIDYGYKYENPTQIYQLTPLYTREEENTEKSGQLIQSLIAASKKQGGAKQPIALQIARYKSDKGQKKTVAQSASAGANNEDAAGSMSARSLSKASKVSPAKQAHTQQDVLQASRGGRSTRSRRGQEEPEPSQSQSVNRSERRTRLAQNQTAGKLHSKSSLLDQKSQAASGTRQQSQRSRRLAAAADDNKDEDDAMSDIDASQKILPDNKMATGRAGRRRGAALKAPASQRANLPAETQKDDTSEAPKKNKKESASATQSDRSLLHPSAPQAAGPALSQLSKKRDRQDKSKSPSNRSSVHASPSGRRRAADLDEDDEELAPHRPKRATRRAKLSSSSEASKVCDSGSDGSSMNKSRRRRGADNRRGKGNSTIVEDSAEHVPEDAGDSSSQDLRPRRRTRGRAPKSDSSMSDGDDSSQNKKDHQSKSAEKRNAADMSSMTRRGRRQAPPVQAPRVERMAASQQVRARKDEPVPKMAQEPASQSVLRRGKKDDMDDASSVSKVSRSARRTARRRIAEDSESDESHLAGAAHQADDVSQDNDDDDFDQVSAILKPQGDFKRDKASFDNEYDEACSKLQLNSIPDELPCRDVEQDHIESYIRQGVQNKGCSSSLYISGMPGTGKTATTLEVIRKIVKAQREKTGPKQRRVGKFDFIHINAMALTNPNLVYTVLAEKILGRKMNPQAAALFLDEFFRIKDKRKLLQRYMTKKTSTRQSRSQQDLIQKTADRVRLLLIDELDALITPKQTLLYNLFEWPCNQNSRLLVISIANTMDLPERLQSKIQSRIGNNRLVYEPYNSSQITQILEARLRGIEVFDQRSIKIVAAKVSSYSGDIRRSLQITKRAVELCRDEFFKERDRRQAGKRASRKLEARELKKVAADHVVSAYDEMSNSNIVRVMKGLRKLEVLILIALYLENHAVEKVELDRLQDRCVNVLKAMQEHEQSQKKGNMFGAPRSLEEKPQALVNYGNWEMSFLTTAMFREIIKRLQAYGLISLLIETHKLTENAHVSHLNFFDYCDLKNAFQHNEIYQVQEKFISMCATRS